MPDWTSLEELQVEGGVCLLSSSVVRVLTDGVQLRLQSLCTRWRACTCAYMQHICGPLYTNFVQLGVRDLTRLRLRLPAREETVPLALGRSSHSLVRVQRLTLDRRYSTFWTDISCSSQ